MPPLSISCRPLRFICHIRGFTTYKSRLREHKRTRAIETPDLFPEEDRRAAKLYHRKPISALPQKEEDKDTIWNGHAAPEVRASGALAGKRAIITGASRGIGAAIAERFAKEGARCVLVGRDEDALSHVKNGLMGLYKDDHVVRVGDVGDLEFWKTLNKSEKKVDILVNAAGITHYTALFKTLPDVLERVVQTNLIGTMMGCRSIGRRMMGMQAVGGGCIINVSSLLGFKGGKGSVGYAASKAGVIGLTRSLAAEIGREGIRVNVIVPGYIESAMTAAMTPEARSNAIDAIPLGRFGQASDVADAALFLATNEYANNCVLNLDGGLSAT